MWLVLGIVLAGAAGFVWWLRGQAGPGGGGSASAPRFETPLPVSRPTAHVPRPELAWQHYGIYAIFSSPRVMDVNGDGVGDVIHGQGAEAEMQSNDSFGYVLALDGRTGEELWNVPARKAIVGSATMIDVTGDGQPEVIIGGRDAELLALDAPSGELLWRFDTTKYPRFKFNFYTAAPVPDQDGDGIADLVVANGGDSSKPPGAPREVGFLGIFSGATGEVVSWLEMPDGNETYMSPVVYHVDDEPYVIFGSGGETLPGSLWRIRLADLRQQRADAATRILQGREKGFIAPPAFAQLNVAVDDTPDLVVPSFEGELFALDGRTLETLWANRLTNSESYSQPAIGDFNGDGSPDVLAVFLNGIFPAYEAANYLIVDGLTGRIEWNGTLSTFAMSGGVVADLNGDGLDDGLWAQPPAPSSAASPNRISSTASPWPTSSSRRWASQSAPPRPPRPGSGTSMATACWTSWRR